jgi:hypothetical protein
MWTVLVPVLLVFLGGCAVSVPVLLLTAPRALACVFGASASASNQGEADSDRRHAAMPWLGNTTGVHRADEGEGHDHLQNRHTCVHSCV